ncbi:MAG: hypothetical protein ACREMK_02990 [Gemmatimonadota bacterium]
MSRRPIPRLALLAIFGLSLTAPCFAMGMQGDVPMETMNGCANGEAPRADFVCATSFKPAPPADGLRPATLTVARAPLEPQAVLSTSSGVDPSGANPSARNQGPPTYLLHSVFLI